jgi:hypothetical protein
VKIKSSLSVKERERERERERGFFAHTNAQKRESENAI